MDAGQHCQYDTPPRMSELRRSSKPVNCTIPVNGDDALVPQTIPWEPLGLSNSTQRLLELRLMHEYTKSTSDMWSLGAMSPSVGYAMWQIDIPQIAFSSDIVLNATLALSALRLQGTNPGDPILARASLFYFDRAVTKYQEALDRVDKQTADQLIVAAVLVAHHTWLSAHSKSANERYAVDLRTYHMCNGIKALIEEFRPWLDKYDPPPLDQKPSTFEFPDKKGFMLRAMEDLEHLSKAFKNQSMPQERRQAYQRAAEVLIGVYVSIVSGADIIVIEQTIITYLHRIPAEFRHLLDEEDPIAMAMHARIIGLLTHTEDSPAWWIHGVGEHKVPMKCVLGVQALMPPEWQWTMAWPLRIARKEVDLYSGCE